MHIRSGETKLPTEVLTVHNASLDGIRAPKQRGNPRKVAQRDRLANQGAADALTLGLQRLGIAHSKVIALTKRSQHAQVA